MFNESILRELEPGYYISSSGKKAIKVIHWLGQCFVVPGVDYMSYVFDGSSFPETDAYDTVCKWCAKLADFEADQDSSGTHTLPHQAVSHVIVVESSAEL